MSAKPYKSIAVFVALFLLGSVAGATAMRAYMFKEARAELHHPAVKVRARHRMRSMKRRLGLTDEQTKKIETIFDDVHQERATAFAPCKPAMKKLREQINARIKEVLTPEQRKLHDAFTAKRRERHRGKRSIRD